MAAVRVGIPTYLKKDNEMDQVKIYSAIPAIIKEIEAVTKKKNPDSNVKYAYRRIDDFMNALNPMLATHKAFIMPEVISHDMKDFTTSNGAKMLHVIMTIKYTIFAEDGSHVSAIMVGEAFDSGDKASNKAQSVALKYLLAQVFMVPTEDLQDPDDTDHNQPPKAPVKPSNSPATAQKPQTQAQGSVKPQDQPKHNLTPAQINRLNAKAGAAGIPAHKIVETVRARYNCLPSEMRKLDYDNLCAELDKAVPVSGSSGGVSK